MTYQVKFEPKYKTIQTMGYYYTLTVTAQTESEAISQVKLKAEKDFQSTIEVVSIERI